MFRLVGFYLRYALRFVRRDKRSIVLVIILALSISTIVVVHVVKNSVITYERCLYESSRVADFCVDTDYLNLSVISKIKEEVNNIKYCSGLIKYSTNLLHGNDTYHITIFGLEKSPEVNTIPNIDWERFSGNRIIIEPTLAKALGVGKGDILVLFDREFPIYEVRYPIWAPSLELAGCGSIFMPIDTLRSILGVGEVYNRIAIIVWDRSRIAETAYSVVQILNRSNISTINLNFGYIGTERASLSMNIFYAVTDSIVLIVVVLSIIVYVYLDVRNSLRSFVLMEIIGFSLSDVRKIVAFKYLIIVVTSVLSAMILGLAIGNMLFTYSVKLLGLGAPRWMYLGLPTVKLLLMSTLLVFLSYILLSYMIRGYELDRAIRERFSVETDEYKACSRYGRPALKIAVRRISAHRLRTFTLVLLIATTVGCGIALNSLVDISKETYIRDFERIRWDICVIIYSPQKTSYVRNYIDTLPSVNSTEEIILASAPVVRIIGGRKITPPHRTISILGISGNESLWRIRFLSGGIRKGFYVAISSKIAKAADISLGDPMGITFVHPLGMEMTIYVTVSGIFESSALFGGWLIVFDKYAVEKELGVSSNAILVALSDKSGESTVINDILSFLSKESISSNVILKSSHIKRVLRLIAKIDIFVLGLILTTNIMLIVALTLTVISEINKSVPLLAMLYALGMRRVEILKIVLIEYTAILAASVALSILIHHSVLLFLTDLLNSAILPLWIHIEIPTTAYINITLAHLSLLGAITVIANLRIGTLNLGDALRFD